MESFTNINYLLSLQKPAATTRAEKKRLLSLGESYSTNESSDSNENDVSPGSPKKMFRFDEKATNATLQESEGYAQYVEIESLNQQMGDLQVVSSSSVKNIAKSPKAFKNICELNGQSENELPTDPRFSMKN